MLLWQHFSFDVSRVHWNCTCRFGSREFTDLKGGISIQRWWPRSPFHKGLSQLFSLSEHPWSCFLFQTIRWMTTWLWGVLMLNIEFELRCDIFFYSGFVLTRSRLSWGSMPATMSLSKWKEGLWTRELEPQVFNMIWNVGVMVCGSHTCHSRTTMQSSKTAYLGHGLLGSLCRYAIGITWLQFRSQMFFLKLSLEIVSIDRCKHDDTELVDRWKRSHLS